LWEWIDGYGMGADYVSFVFYFILLFKVASLDCSNRHIFGNTINMNFNNLCGICCFESAFVIVCHFLLAWALQRHFCCQYYWWMGRKSQLLFCMCNFIVNNRRNFCEIFYQQFCCASFWRFNPGIIIIIKFIPLKKIIFCGLSLLGLRKIWFIAWNRYSFI